MTKTKKIPGDRPGKTNTDKLPALGTLPVEYLQMLQAVRDGKFNMPTHTDGSIRLAVSFSVYDPKKQQDVYLPACRVRISLRGPSEKPGSGLTTVELTLRLMGHFAAIAEQLERQLIVPGLADES
jgi:hypothetical protein